MNTKSFIAAPVAIALGILPAPLAPLAPIAVMLGLAGCAGGTQQVQTNITAIVNAVIAGVQASCQVSPLAVDIANLVPIYGQDAAAIITAVCAAVAAAPASGKLAARGLRVGVAPVEVHGQLVHFK